jgi:hypothetical protein
MTDQAGESRFACGNVFGMPVPICASKALGLISMVVFPPIGAGRGVIVRPRRQNNERRRLFCCLTHFIVDSQDLIRGGTFKFWVVGIGQNIVSTLKESAQLSIPHVARLSEGVGQRS